MMSLSIKDPRLADDWQFLAPQAQEARLRVYQDHRNERLDAICARDRGEATPDQLALIRKPRATMPHDVRPCHLYRCFSATGELLYVGVSRTRAERALVHLYKEWGEEVDTIKVERHPSREDAEFAEAVAIDDEGPLYNRRDESYRLAKVVAA